MTEYFQYLKEMLIAVFSNIGLWFKQRWADPWSVVPEQFGDYGSKLDQYSPHFGGAGWFFFVFFAILFVLLIFGILFGIYLLFRKVFRFKKTEVDKETLLNEIEKLNMELYETIQEKDRILALQCEALGIAPPKKFNPGEEPEEGEVEEEDPGATRFPRLDQIDKKYDGVDTIVHLPEGCEAIQLNEICERFRYFACSQLGLYYTIDTIRAIFASMGTSKLIILEGISGTGKTSLPYCMGRFFEHSAVICAVQPSWRERSELLGYYNDFSHKFNETQFLAAIYEATYRDDPNLIVLDEMNLARIEYYFAEFLSIMEMPNTAEWIINLVAAPKSSDPKHMVEGTLLIPQNCWFFGTANNDDSTFTITDKVYDRAMSLFFDNKGRPFEAPFTEALPMPYEYLLQLYAEAKETYPVSETIIDKFGKLDDFVIKNFKLAFGNRIMKQIRGFVPCYVACGGTELEAIDFMFDSKILKKFEVLNVGFLKDELNDLDKMLTQLFGKDEFKKSRAKISYLLKMSGN